MRQNVVSVSDVGGREEESFTTVDREGSLPQIELILKSEKWSLLRLENGNVSRIEFLVHVLSEARSTMIDALQCRTRPMWLQNV